MPKSIAVGAGTGSSSTFASTVTDWPGATVDGIAV